MDDVITYDLHNLNLAAYCEMDSYDAVRTYALHTRTALITDVTARRDGGDASQPGVVSLSVPAVSPLRSIIQQQQERRLAWRRGVRGHLAYINTKRCARTPLYSHGLRRSASVVLTVTKLQQICECEVAPSEAPTCVRELVLSMERRYLEMEPTLSAFASQITPARAPPPRLSTQHDPTEAAKGVRIDLALRAAPKPMITLMQPVAIRRSLQFPDKRLIQWDCGKLQVLAVLLRRLNAEGHRCLIFTQMTKMLNVLESWINICGFTYLRLDGATKVEDRQRLMDRFNLNPKIFIFILATRAGGLGINLTGADTVIFYDSDWNPTIDAQAQDRAHRIGQTRQVHIYRLVSEATIEENILRKANQKRLLDSVVIQSGQFDTDFFKGNSITELFVDGPSVREQASDAASAPAESANEVASSGKGRKAKQVRTPRGTRKEPAEPEAQPEAQPDGGPSAAEIEAAMLSTQDAEDVEGMQAEHNRMAEDEAEFDESIPYNEETETKPPASSDQGETSADESKRSVRFAVTEKPQPSALDQQDLQDFGQLEAKGDNLVEQLESALTPVQRYMLRFIEEVTPAATEAEEAAHAFKEEEWELDQMQKFKEQVEAAADEDDEVLYYEVAPKGNKAKGKTAAGSGASYAEMSLNNVANYLLQQQGTTGLELTQDLAELEVSLWGPPSAPDKDIDELYNSATAASDDEPLKSGTISLEFSGLVTDGARGVQVHLRQPNALWCVPLALLSARPHPENLTLAEGAPPCRTAAHAQHHLRAQAAGARG